MIDLGDRAVVVEVGVGGVLGIAEDDAGVGPALNGVRLALLDAAVAVEVAGIVVPRLAVGVVRDAFAFAQRQRVRSDDHDTANPA